MSACESCGGSGILIVSWDTLGEPQDGQVYVDTCDDCTTGDVFGPLALRAGEKVSREDAAYAVAKMLKTNIILVRDPGWSWKHAIQASVEEVERAIALLDSRGTKFY